MSDKLQILGTFVFAVTLFIAGWMLLDALKALALGAGHGFWF